METANLSKVCNAIRGYMTTASDSYVEAVALAAIAAMGDNAQKIGETPNNVKYHNSKVCETFNDCGHDLRIGDICHTCDMLNAKEHFSKNNITKDWCMNMAKLEGDCEVSAGMGGFRPFEEPASLPYPGFTIAEAIEELAQAISRMEKMSSGSIIFGIPFCKYLHEVLTMIVKNTTK